MPAAIAIGLRRRARQSCILQDCRGIAAIEFAIAGPIVILLMMTLFEAGFLLTGSIFLDAGARSAARYGITGASQPGETREEIIRDIVTESVCPRALPDADSDLCFWSEAGSGEPLEIETRAYTDPRNVGEPEPFSDLPPENGRYDAGEIYTDINGNGRWDSDMAVASAGGAGDVVIYTLTMAQAVHTPLLRAAIGGAFYRHQARLVVRNEPF